MNVCGINLLGASGLEHLRGAAAEALERWCAAWGARVGAPRIACGRAWELEQCDRPFGEDGLRWECSDGRAWAVADPGLPARVHGSLFGSARESAEGAQRPTVAMEICDRALDELVQQLVASLAPRSACRRAEGRPADLPAHLLRHGSGAAVLDIEMGGGRLRLVVSGEPLADAAISKPRPGASPVHDFPSAMQSLPVALKAELGEIEMDLGTLQSLEPGDVVRLPARIDQTLRLSGPGGKTVCFGEFGSQDGFRALVLRKSAVQEGA